MDASFSFSTHITCFGAPDASIISAPGACFGTLLAVLAPQCLFWRLQLECPSGLDLRPEPGPSPTNQAQGPARPGPARFDCLNSGPKPGPNPIPRLSIESVVIKGSSPGTRPGPTRRL